MKFIEYAAHFLIPRNSNNHKARLLHSPILMAIIACLFVYQLTLSSVSSVFPKVLGFASSIPMEEVVRLTNEKRVEAGLGPLSFNSALASAARDKAVDMLEHNYWAHVSPNGVTPWDFFKNNGYTYRFAGENLARDFSNPSSVVDAWMASQSHKENLLSPKYEEIGVAVVEGDLAGVDTTLVVQLFAAPVAKTAQAANVETRPQPKPEALIASVQTSQRISGGPLLSPLDTTKGMSTAVLGLLLGVFAVDEIIVYRRKIFRVSGRGVAHMSFLTMILLVVLIIKSGQIL
ncbi:MAG: hypothetical protein ACD_52C00135G0007 [uncultured bacterium]|uniref:SCP domain-containing protein n=1 Tax=Candidatus Woesebacteria bacterium RIFCSPHIGHO2_12_FULL_41_24 TaxID=1802510 RepID=A0A1F8AUE8_9BACT|nr:MAG: hypothetical protein ACD_52C00135G0007 [uncultured bacterium]OGM14392.1 MAG: hypothetical protein A2W15_02475 [Candidatus Woesebacteria bacterium RBG_16_41_13]OGM28610.1 MAG: hypothetical protein A2873_05750 [Candidatus Woesebacteria bacterium RIFCSPHIGHO2_01_FULL_42_80]OGM34169.1 MAG: hypothetical protein A3D84_04125 [Candidatus Woesebacteria bacterium RIFCSPHIGHO2_02_FULL_42_20]OGM55374.1 MAG: hypothetical protein A3E44_03770 [Candidatus Woesebacteria bacterium RIFCSPHIGHO2_12_FULL_41